MCYVQPQNKFVVGSEGDMFGIMLSALSTLERGGQSGADNRSSDMRLTTGDWHG